MLKDNALAKATKSNYKTPVRYFEEMCIKLGLPNKVTEKALIAYIGLRLETKVLKQTVIGDINAICTNAILKGEDVQIADDSPLVGKLMKGYGNTITRPTLQRVAISIDKLSLLASHFLFNANTNPAYRTFHAAAVIAFWCMLRPSEYTYHSKHPQKLLINSNVKFGVMGSSQYVELTLINPKTAQHGSQKVVASCKCKICEWICPVHVLKKYISWKQKSFPTALLHPSRAFFLIKNNKVKLNASPLRYDLWCESFPAFAEILGINAATFKPHCMRISGASYYFLSGIHDEVIKILGRWTSECWRRYLRLSAEQAIFLVDEKILNDVAPNGFSTSELLRMLSANDPSVIHKKIEEEEA